MLDINNIISKLSKEQILHEIKEITKNVLSIDEETKIYFVETPSVVFRADIKKEEIFSLNEYLKNNLDESIKYIELNKEMIDEFKNLKLEYTYDGYHLNEVGYKKIKAIIEKEIQKILVRIGFLKLQQFDKIRNLKVKQLYKQIVFTINFWQIFYLKIKNSYYKKQDDNI